MKTVFPTSFRLAADDLARLERLTPPGHSKAETVQRALAALEAVTNADDVATLSARIAAVEDRLEQLESPRPKKDVSKRTEEEEARIGARAAELKAAGKVWREIPDLLAAEGYLNRNGEPFSQQSLTKFVQNHRSTMQ
jgi:uncharacterized small protein (DUF1192 family)